MEINRDEHPIGPGFSGPSERMPNDRAVGQRVRRLGDGPVFQQLDEWMGRRAEPGEGILSFPPR